MQALLDETRSGAPSDGDVMSTLRRTRKDEDQDEDEDEGRRRKGKRTTADGMMELYLFTSSIWWTRGQGRHNQERGRHGLAASTTKADSAVIPGLVKERGYRDKSQTGPPSPSVNENEPRELNRLVVLEFANC